MAELRFLLDENVSPTHVPRLNALGHLAFHVNHLRLATAKDSAILSYAYDNSLIIVSKNAIDFLDLAAAVDVHAGMILLRRGDLRIDDEWRWLAAAVEHLVKSSIDPLNKVINVTGPDMFHVDDVPAR